MIERACGLVLVNVELPSIGYCNSHLDIASDYLDALFVGENIYEFCDEIDWTDEYDQASHLRYIQYRIRVHDIDGLLQKARWLAAGINNEDECDQEEFEQVRSYVSDFESDLPFRRVHFVELADNYMLNEITGQSYENIGDETDANVWAEFFPNQPECRFRYFLSAMTSEFGGPCYCSSYDWVISAGLPIETMLRKYGGMNALELTPALIISSKGTDIATNNSVAVRLDHAAFSDPLEMLRETGRVTDETFTAFRMSQDGSILIADLKQWMLVNFAAGEGRLGKLQLESLLNEMEVGTESIRQCLGRPTALACNWNLMSDEQFERLCCEALARCGHYDPARIMKMGRSRSRDGGRDIVTFSNLPLKRSGGKFIFQCKRIGKDKALGGKNVSVSDVVDQFNAGGFGIMTSGLIDSTLYDKIEQITATRSLQRDFWDQLRLERFLAENLDIKRRYFDSRGEPIGVTEPT